MSNQWLNELRKKMEDHTDDVPDGLWNNIKEELFDKEEENNIVGLITEEDNMKDVEEKTSINSIKPLVYKISGIAAAIVLFLIVGKQLLEIRHNTQVVPEITKSKDSSISKENDNRSNNGTSIGSTEGKENLNSDTVVSNKIMQKGSFHLGQDVYVTGLYQQGKRNSNDMNQNAQGNNKIERLIGLHIQNAAVIQNQIPRISEKTRLINREEEIDKLVSETDIGLQNKSIAAATKEKKQKSKTSWMLSLLTGKASSNSQQFPGYATMSGGPLTLDQVWSASGYSEDPFIKVLVANQSQNVEATVRHKVPLNLGISLYYNLGKRWGIGTGLNYTKLSSELHSGSPSNFVKSDQTIHYVGIPVQVNYNVIQKGQFTGYVTGGALVEKSVAGSFKTKYVVDNVVNDETSERLGNQPVQVSLNTALGVQLKLVDKIGIYAEPGVGYHFKNDGSLNTIYKEKPLNFNIKFGIRVLLD